MLSIEQLREGISRYRKKYVGSEDMSVVIDYTYMHSRSAGTAIQSEGKVYINPHIIRDYEDIEIILRHEDLGHLIIENVLNDKSSFIKLCLEIWKSNEFKTEYNSINESYYESCVEIGETCYDVGIDPEVIKKYVYPSEFIALWVQEHEYLKYSFISKFIKSKINKKLNEYMRIYKYEKIERPGTWTKGRVTEKYFPNEVA